MHVITLSLHFGRNLSRVFLCVLFILSSTTEKHFSSKEFFFVEHTGQVSPQVALLFACQQKYLWSPALHSIIQLVYKMDHTAILLQPGIVLVQALYTEFIIQFESLLSSNICLRIISDY